MANAASWLALVLTAAGAVGGVVFAAWTSESLNLDATLMPLAEKHLGALPPHSTIGRDDVPVDVLRQQAKATEAKGDLAGAAVAWQKVLARDPTDPTAKSALPRVQSLLR